jgi:hypothetical protein
MAKAPTEKELITTYNGRNIVFYPNSHRYKYEEAKTYLVSPSSVVGVLDKSNALLIWNDRLITAFIEKTAKENPTWQDWEVVKMVEDALGQRKIKLEEAGEVGDVIHAYAERTAWAKTMGEPLPEIPELPEDTDENRAKHEQIMSGIQSFLKFEQEENVEYLDAERFVYSESHVVPYVGRFDTIMGVRGMRVLVDYKTSKGVYSSQKYQLGGYDLALIEEHEYRKQPLPYDAVGILHFDKNTGVPTLHILTEEERKMSQDAFKALLIVKDIEKVMNVWSGK